MFSYSSFQGNQLQLYNTIYSDTFESTNFVEMIGIFLTTPGMVTDSATLALSGNGCWKCDNLACCICNSCIFSLTLMDDNKKTHYLKHVTQSIQRYEFGLHNLQCMTPILILIKSQSSMLYQKASHGDFYRYVLTLIPASIAPIKKSDEITYPYPNFNGCTRWSLGMD